MTRKPHRHATWGIRRRDWLKAAAVAPSAGALRPIFGSERALEAAAPEPAWLAFNPSTGPLMMFDTTCRVANDQDRQLPRLVEEA